MNAVKAARQADKGRLSRSGGVEQAPPLALGPPVQGDLTEGVHFGRTGRQEILCWLTTPCWSWLVGAGACSRAKSSLSTRRPLRRPTSQVGILPDSFFPGLRWRDVANHWYCQALKIFRSGATGGPAGPW